MTDQTPGSIGDALGAAAEPPVIPFNGKTYRVGAPTVAALEALEKLVARQALAGPDELRDVLDPAEYAAEKEHVRAMIAGRAHRLGGDLFARVLAGPSGWVLVLLACLRQSYPELTEADAIGMMRDAPEATRDALAQVTPAFFMTAGRARGLDPRTLEAAIVQGVPIPRSTP